MIRSVSALAIGVSAFAPAAASARDERHSIAIGEGDLTEALALLATQTGATVGIGVSLRGLRASPVRGRMTTADALQRLLRGARLDTIRLGPEIYRIAARRITATVPARLADAPVAPDIVVTARKYAEVLSRAGAALAVYVPAGSAAAGPTALSAPGIREISGAIEGLSVTNLGSGRDRPFIRGVADSPFNGFGQTTVSVNVDEARVTYDAPEPGLRLVDVARVEVLKGPQGPLYGTGALGGVYRIVTNKPDIDTASLYTAGGFTVLDHGGIGADAQAVANLPLVDHTAALRLVGYSGAEPGWIDNVGGKSDANTGLMRGARAELRIVPADGWTVDLGGMWQRVDLDDSQYVDRDLSDLARRLAVREPSSSAFRLAQGVVSGPVGTLRLTIASSHAWQDRTEVYDASDSRMLGTRAQSYRDARHHRVLDQEIRIGSASGLPFTWTAGLSYVSATTVATGAITTPRNEIVPYFRLDRTAAETAAFVDASMRVLPKLSLGLGVRAFVSETSDERSGDLMPDAKVARSLFGVNPSAALTYEVASDGVIFARLGTALRPGGIDPENIETGRYDADEVRSTEIGARGLLDGGRLSLEAGVFRSAWTHVQSDYLQNNGLVATHNVGDAVILGGEVSATWRPGGWGLQVGAGYQRGRLKRASKGNALPQDVRLPVVPDVTARWEISRRIGGADLPTHLYVGGSYIGAARLSFDPGLDRPMGNFATFRAGAVFSIDGVDVRLESENLLDARADTFAFGNPFSVLRTLQYTPLRPPSVRIGFAKHFR